MHWISMILERNDKECSSSLSRYGPPRRRRVQQEYGGLRCVLKEWVSELMWLIDWLCSSGFQFHLGKEHNNHELESWCHQTFVVFCFFFPLRIGGMKVSPSSSSVKNFNLEGPITSRGWRMGRSPGGVIPCRVLIVGIGGMHQIPWVLVPFSEQHRRYIYLECPEIWRSAYVC